MGGFKPSGFILGAEHGAFLNPSPGMKLMCPTGWRWPRCAAGNGAAALRPTMALSCALRMRHRHPVSALLSSLPGWDRSLPAQKAAAQRKEKGKGGEGRSLPHSSWEER